VSPQDSIKKQELIAKAAPHIPPPEFEDALQEAKEYHKAHPPLEEKLIGEPTDLPMHPNNAERMERKKDFIDLINEGTIAELVDDHRQKIMIPFRKRMVPVELAAEIVDNLVLWS
jgi:hypothetical protein